MPIHDWTRVNAGIFHAFHHSWVEEIARALNGGLLPSDYYALPEQHAAGFGPDVLTLQGSANDPAEEALPGSGSTGEKSVLLAPPRLQPTAETDLAFYRRRQKVIAVRHVSGDRIIAIVEIVSAGNKASRNAMRAFVQKAADLLEHGIHLLIIDLYPPGKRDPEGIHGAIWQEFAGKDYMAPAEKPLTLAAYEAGDTVRAYVVRVAVGDPFLADMPLFLEPQQSISVPLNATYQAAFAAVPRRWRRVLQPETPG